MRANNVGEFLIPNVASGKLRIRAECDGMRAEAPVLVEGKPTPVRLFIENTSPRIMSVVAGSRDSYIRRAAPGTTVRISVNVQDGGKKRLHYQWYPSDAGNTFVSEDSPTVNWTLPRAPDCTRCTYW